MRILALVLAGALATVGCLGDDPGDEGPSSSLDALVFEQAQRMPSEHIAAEPNIITGPDGAVWIVAPGSVVTDQNVDHGEVHLWRSDHHGATWETLRQAQPKDDEGRWCSCDADIDIGPDGALYLTDFWVSRASSGLPVGLPVGANGFVVEASPDGGETWGTGNFVTVTNVVGNDRQYITAGNEPGVVFLSYARGTLDPNLPDGGLHLWRSDDGGASFTQMTQVAPATASHFPIIAKPRVGPDDTVFFAYGLMPNDDPWTGPASVALAVSTDGGASFETRHVVDVPGGLGGIWPVQIDVGPDGVVHVVYMEPQDGGGYLLRYTWSDDGGASFAEPRVVSWPDGTAFLPWIAHAGEGRAVIAYYGSPERVEPMEAPEDTRWDTWALVVDTDGRASAPARASPFPVKLGVFCPLGAACPHDRELLDYPAVAHNDGWVQVTFAVSLEDEGAGPEASVGQPTGGHDANAHIWHARASLG